MTPKAGANGFTGLGALLRRIFFGLGRRSVFGGALEHLGSLPLTAHSSLALVRLHKETLLLGITSHNITLLSKGNDEAGFGPGSITQKPVALREEPLPQVKGPAR
jgi:flagellar biogenesis protein FliO